jgi:hypothetical protein
VRHSMRCCRNEPKAQNRGSKGQLSREYWNNRNARVPTRDHGEGAVALTVPLDAVGMDEVWVKWLLHINPALRFIRVYPMNTLP